MTRLGKLLIFFNLILSVLYTTWALGIYFQRIDWAPGVTATGEKIPGKLDRLADEVKQVQKVRDLTELRWQTANRELQKREQERPSNQAWFDEQIKVLNTGKNRNDQPVDPPVQELAFQGGQLVIGPQPRPAFNHPRTMQPAKPLNSYKDEYDRLVKEFNQVQQDELDLIEREKKLTVQLNGEADQRGMRSLLAEEKQAEKMATDEQVYLKPLKVNREVEAQLLLRRRVALEARKKELEELLGMTPAPGPNTKEK